MKTKMPFGFKVLFVLGGANLIWQIVTLLKGNYFRSDLYGFSLSQPINLLIPLVYIIVSLLTTISLIKRYSWGWKLILLSGGVGVLLSLFAWYKVITNYPATFSVIVVTIIYGLVGIIAGFVGWYVYKNRKYFNK